MATICWVTPGCCVWTMGAGTAFHHLVLVRCAIHVAAWSGDLALLLCPWVWVEFHSEIVKADHSLRNHAWKYSSFQNTMLIIVQNQNYILAPLSVSPLVCPTVNKSALPLSVRLQPWRPFILRFQPVHFPVLQHTVSVPYSLTRFF